MFLTNGYKKGEAFASPTSCGGLTRTDDLWVMSPTSYQLLHSAMLILLVGVDGFEPPTLCL